MKFGLLLLTLVAVSASSLINNNVNRVVDLSTQIAKVKIEVEVSNTGTKSVSVYEVYIDLSVISHLSYIAVSQGNKKLSLKKQADGVHEAKLLSAIAPGDSTDLVIQMTFTHVLEPFPSSINQPDNQLVRHHGNCFFYSPYATTDQSARFDLGSSKIESFTPRTPSNKDGSSVIYGPYKDIPAKSNAKVTIHFENNSPFLTITSLKRIIEVSHWGNVAIEEHYAISHSGAILKSPFSRLDFQRNPIGAPTAIKSFRTVLPASSRDVYYRDDIGNISTSNLRETEDANELEIRPRFPLFGGWKTKYYIGYSVPSYEMLSYSGDMYKLECAFVDHSYDNLVVDEVEVKVILPEGASDLDVVYPSYEIKREADSKHKTYLDTFGRPVLTFTAKNLEENHIQNIEVYYKFNSLMMLQEPLLVVGAFMVLFLTVIVFVRLDFSIAVDEDREARQRAVYLVEELLTLANRIKNNVSDDMVELLSSSKTSKDAKSFKNKKRELEAQYKQLYEEANVISKKVVSVAPTLSERVAEVSKREGDRKAVLSGILTLAEKVINDKISKNMCNDQQATLLGKLSTAERNIEDAIAAL